MNKVDRAARRRAQQRKRGRQMRGRRVARSFSPLARPRLWVWFSSHPVLTLYLVALGILLAAYLPVWTNNFPFPQHDDAFEVGVVRDTVADRDIGRFVLLAHADHVVPLLRILYLVMWTTFDDWWPAYGFVLLACAALAAAGIGYLVWRYSSSLGSALVVVWLLTTSVLWSTGILAVFAYAHVYILIAAACASVAVGEKCAKRDSGLFLAAAFGLTLGGALIALPGIFNSVMLAVAYMVFGWSALGWRHVVRSRRTYAFLGVLALAVAGYFTMVFLGYHYYNNPLPGTADFGGRPVYYSNQLLIQLDHTLYGAYGWLMPVAIFDHNQGFFLLLRQLRPLLVAFSAIGLTWLAFRMRRRRPANPASSDAYAACTVLVLSGLAWWILIFSGRASLFWWNIRYQYITTAAAAVILGVITVLLLRRLQRTARIAAGGFLVACSIALGVASWQTVTDSMEYVRFVGATR